MKKIIILLLLAGCWFTGDGSAIGDQSVGWPGFIQSEWFDEQVREIRFADGARALLNAPHPLRFRKDRTTLLLLYATPNGSSVEQTLGCRQSEDLDWHYDIQQVAAQVRRWRAAKAEENIVLACIQSDIRSWPAWRRTHQNAALLIRRMVDSLAAIVPAGAMEIGLAGHSGGGSFIFGLLDAADNIPNDISRIVFLDANYGYSDDRRHGEKILRWLDADPRHQFVVLAYDDRKITLNGKKVVSPTGGTFRASHRMIERLRREISWTEDKFGEFDRFMGLNGRLLTIIHPNPENKILHTRLVGEMNGLLYSLAVGSRQAQVCARLESQRAYTDWIQPLPYDPNRWPCRGAAISPRSADAPAASKIVQELLEIDLRERELVILAEILAGNVPDFLRTFVEVRAHAEVGEGTRHEIVYRVMPDYLSIGSDGDFFRMPLTPQSAQHVADLFGCILPTRKMVDRIYQQATVKLPPQPLVQDRQSFATFLQHHGMVQKQLEAHAERGLVAGVKKDVVVTNELKSRPGHVAIYGWHRLNGKPIQPLTTVHVDGYVDYSHGVRLVDQCVLLDGKPAHIRDILEHEDLNGLLSDEGPIRQAKYLDREAQGSSGLLKPR